LRFKYEGIWEEVLDKAGTMPLPPYIHEQLMDKERYQTVYSKIPGSAAAPTAGLHFTEELLKEIEDMGVIKAEVTLDVGLGTFRPVKSDNIEQHEMHSERYTFDQKASDILRAARAEGRRIVSVRTKSTRVPETVAASEPEKKPGSGETHIFI
jgi:S-adenosylmethionine:tRNA ribosyltransferase-isomerase